jgi:hypothetical protein
MSKKDRTNYFLVFIMVQLTVQGYTQENASNPLAAVSNTDLRYQFYDLGDANLNEYFIDGAYMATPKLKLKYELHYWNSDLSGSWQSGFQSIHFKPVYFPLQGKWGSWKYKLAVGVEWILEFNAPITQGCPEYPISCLPGFTGSDQIAPFVGLSLVTPKGTLLIPLVQQFISYNGTKVNMTAMRLIAIQSLPKGFWGKLDAIVPIDWENDVVPATAEVQLGKMFSSSIGTYVDGMFGVGGDKPYNWGIGLGVRFNY